MAFAGPPGSEGLLSAVAAGPVCHHVGRGCQGIMPLGGRGNLDWRAGDAASPARLARLGQEAICKTVLDRHSQPRCGRTGLARACPAQRVALAQEARTRVSPQRSVWLCRQGGDPAPGRRFWEEEPGQHQAGGQSPGKPLQGTGRASYVVRHGDTTLQLGKFPSHLASVSPVEWVNNLYFSVSVSTSIKLSWRVIVVTLWRVLGRARPWQECRGEAAGEGSAWERRQQRGSWPLGCGAGLC